MSDEVRDSYDAVAEKYAELFLGALDTDAQTRAQLASFAELAALQKGAVADLGCGPGDVTNHLTGLGLTVTGYDLSPGQIAQAHKAFPDLQFQVGDLTALQDVDASLGGIVSRYSLIHIHPSLFNAIFLEWMRALEPGAPIAISFFGSKSAEAHGTPFDHTVATAYELFPATVAEQLQDVGFIDVEIEANPIPEGGRPFDHVSLLARKSGETPMPEEVAAVFDACDHVVRGELLRLRELILRTAGETKGVGAITETLKWGEPAYLTGETKSGSTIRIAPAKPGAEHDLAMLFICNTHLVERFEGLFGDAFTYEGGRALLFTAGKPLPTSELRACIEMALTYHLDS